MDIANSNRAATREVVSNMEEEDKAVRKEKKRVEAMVLNKLTSPCMGRLEAALVEGRGGCGKTRGGCGTSRPLAS